MMECLILQQQSMTTELMRLLIIFIQHLNARKRVIKIFVFN